MPRGPRIVLPNHPHHVIQRGHDRRAVFVEDADRVRYLATLREWKEKLACKVYGYCLMTNHVHLIINPGDDPENLGRLMKRVAGRYTRYVNRLEGRTGTAWDGRYKSSPIDSERYLMACGRYVERNPERAGMVTRPEDHRWSSCRAKVGLCPWGWLDADSCYLSIGRTPAERERVYRDFVLAPIPDEEAALIRSAVNRGQLTGGRRFIEEVERRFGRRVERRGPGRPRQR